ncbi:MAG: replicative DNA helicase [Archaeoglobus sp.]|nr:replicative DNA helicase [Archaeoglobus sp.]
MKTPPNSIDAEQSILGSILITNDSIEEVIETIQPEMFYLKSHQVIYRKMIELYNEDKPIDLITLPEKLGEQLEKVGGVQYLTDLVSSVPTTANIKIHANILVEKYKYRKLIEAGKKLQEIGYEEQEDGIDEAEKIVLDIQGKLQKRNFYLAKDIAPKVLQEVQEQIENKGQLPGISWGFEDIDIMTGGLIRSDLIVIGARPSMGKTSFALEVVRNIAIEKRKPVAIFELEMSKEQLIKRLACIQALIDTEKVKLGTIEFESPLYNRLLKAFELIYNSPILIDDTPGIRIGEIRSKARKMKRIFGDLPVIVIDYLQLMGGEGSRREVIEYNSRKLKELAKELNSTIILLSQLSRSCEQRENKRPVLSDLRETGAIEQDADLVAFLYRDEYYNPDTSEKGVAEFIIRKQRDGAVGTVKLGWLSDFTKFIDFKKIERYR